MRNNRNESFWNFVLIQKELDKGPFVVCVLRVDTSAIGTKQCEAITNVAIRIMRVKGMDEQ